MILDLNDEDVVLKMEANIVAWGLCGVYIIAAIILRFFAHKPFSTFNIVTLSIIALFTCWDRVRTYIMLREQIIEVNEELTNDDDDMGRM